MLTNKTPSQQEDYGKGAGDLKHYGESQIQETDVLHKSKGLWAGYMKELLEKKKSIIDRLAFTKAEKNLLKANAEHELRQFNLISENQNKMIELACKAKLRFFETVVNVQNKIGRAGIVALADVVATRINNERAINLEIEERKFFDLIESKLADAEKRSAMIRAMREREIEMELKRHAENIIYMEEHFGEILREKL